MAIEMRKVLSEALKLPPRERVVVAEKLLDSVESDEGSDDEDAVQAAWAEEIRSRSEELRTGTVKGLSVEEARTIVTSRSDAARGSSFDVRSRGLRWRQRSR